MMRPSSDSTSRNAFDARRANPEATHARRARRRAGRGASASSSRLAAVYAAVTACEPLEGRQLLATVSGNQIGLYAGPSGPVKVDVGGRGTFNFVGATLDANGQPQLNDIPMTVFDTGGNVVSQNLGGYGGLDGIAPISDVVDTTTSNSADGASAIATDNRGRTYGVGRQGSFVSVVRYDFGNNGTATLEDQTLGAKMLALVKAQVAPSATAGDLRRIIGADFDPSTDASVDQNQLYFAANYAVLFPTGTNTSQRVNVPVMFTYNVSTHAVGIVRGEFGFLDETSKVHVADFTIISGSRVAWFGSVQQGNQQGNQQDINGLYITSTQLVTDDNFQLLRVGPNDPATGNPPDPLKDIASMEFVPGTNNYLYVVQDNSAADDGTRNTATDDNAVMDRFTLTGGGTNVSRGVLIGNVDDPDNDPTGAAGRGDNLDDLSWNPRLEQQFFEPGKRGLMLGVDTGTNEIVGIDIRQRFASTDLFAIYGKNVSSNTTISIANATLNPNVLLSFNTRLFTSTMDAYGGTAGAIRSNMIPGNPPPPVPLGATGGLYIGLRTIDQANAPTIPVIGLPSSSLNGGGIGVSLPNTVRPGIFIDGTLKDVFVGGTITGSVHIDGSLDTFYAGNVLTGDVLNGTQNLENNFNVTGDLRNLLVLGGIGAPEDGTDGNFVPNTDINVGGRIQAIKTGATWRASLDVGGATSQNSITTTVDEIENVIGNANPNDLFEGRNLTQASFGKLTSSGPGLSGGLFRNDSPDAPQIVGSFTSKTRGKGQQVQISGVLNNSVNIGDTSDYYGVPLLAGQTVTVQATSAPFQQTLTGNVGTTSLSSAVVTVYDPEGRAIASDTSNIASAAFRGAAFGFKATEPGLYRIAVTIDPTLINLVPYQLTLDNLGQLAIGGLVSGGSALFENGETASTSGTTLPSSSTGVRVRNADFGALLASGQLGSGVLGGYVGRRNIISNTITADKGSLRSIEALSIGQSDATLTAFGGFPTFGATKGSIGAVRADGAGPLGFVYFNQYNLNPISGRPSTAQTIGGDYQLVQGQGDFSAVMSANGSIGVIRVGSVGTRAPITLSGYLEINADNRGTATMGLLDVTGDLGEDVYGGPALFAGSGGNFRYMHVGGTTYRDIFFGGGETNAVATTDAPITLRDDSGTQFRITPVQTKLTSATGTSTGTGVTVTDPSDPFGGAGNNVYDPFNGIGSTGSGTNGGFNNPFGNSPSVPAQFIVGDLQVATYPVRSGGVMVTNLLSTTGVDIRTVGKRNGGGSGVVDITTLRTGHTGSAVVVPAPAAAASSSTTTTDGNGNTVTTGIGATAAAGPSQLTPLYLAAGQTLDVILGGSGALNVFEIGADIFTPAPSDVVLDPVTGLASTTVNTAALGITDTAQYTRIINNTSGEIVNVNATSIGRLEAAQLGVSDPVANTAIEGSTTIIDSRFPADSMLPGLGNAYPFNQAKNAIHFVNAIDIVSRGAIGNVAAVGEIQNVVANSGNKNDKSKLEGIVAPIAALGSIRRVEIGEGIASSGSGDIGFAGVYAQGDIGLITNNNGHGDIRGDVISGQFTQGIQLGGSGSILNADILNTATNFTTGQEINRIGTSNTGQLTDASIGIGPININGTGGIMSSEIFGSNQGKITVGKNGFGIFTSYISTLGGSAQMDGASVGGLGMRGTYFTGGGFVGKITATGDGKLRRISEFPASVRLSVNKSGADNSTLIGANAANDLYTYLGLTPKKDKQSGFTDEGVLEDDFIAANRSLDSVKAWDIRARYTNGTRPRDETYPMQVNFGDSIGTVAATRDLNGVRMVGGTIGKVSSGRDMTQVLVQTTDDVGSVTAGRNVSGTARFNITSGGTLGTFQVNGFMNGVLFASKGIGSFIVKGDLGSDDGDNFGIRTDGSIGSFLVGGSLVRSASVKAGKAMTLLIIDGDVGAKASIQAASFGKQKIGGTVYGTISRV